MPNFKKAWPKSVQGRPHGHHLYFIVLINWVQLKPEATASEAWAPQKQEIWISNFNFTKEYRQYYRKEAARWAFSKAAQRALFGLPRIPLRKMSYMTKCPSQSGKFEFAGRPVQARPVQARPVQARPVQIQISRPDLGIWSFGILSVVEFLAIKKAPL